MENIGPRWAFKLNSAVALAEAWDLKGHMLKFKAINGLFYIIHELFTSFIEIFCGTSPNDALHCPIFGVTT
jgi:hypothetical protein